MSGMREPSLSRALVLEARVETADGAGGFEVSWVPMGTLWADVRLRSGREVSRAGAALSRAAYRIIVRAAPPGSPQRPAPDQRFREGDRLYRIEAVADADAAGRYLTCFANEEVAA